MTREKYGRNNWVLGIYNPACLVTLSGLLASIIAIVLATRGMYEIAMAGLIFAGIADLFDGVVARRLQLDSFAKEYGVQLDTVVDIVAFIMTPLVLPVCLSDSISHGRTSTPLVTLVKLAFGLVVSVAQITKGSNGHFHTEGDAGRSRTGRKNQPKTVVDFSIHVLEF